MRPRRAWLAIVSVAALLTATPLDTSARRMRPTTELRAHEWGVWLFESRVLTIDDLARESPAFVHRAGPQLPLVVAPVSIEDLVNRPTLKPVVFFHAPREVAVQVNVGFHNGTPWLHYPAGTSERLGAEAGLRFTGRVVPNGRAAAPTVVRGHFWNHLRAASESVFLADNGESEGFIFYDGPSEVAREVVARRSGDSVIVHADVAQTAYLVDRGRFLTVRPEPDVTVSIASIAASGGRTRALERMLIDELVLRRLTRAEAIALVRTWHHELFDAQPLHIVSIISRVAYDAALPIRITPTPSELVRVGLIIEHL